MPLVDYGCIHAFGVATVWQKHRAIHLQCQSTSFHVNARLLAMIADVLARGTGVYRFGMVYKDGLWIDAVDLLGGQSVSANLITDANAARSITLDEQVRTHHLVGVF